ncbi:MAG TPA: ATP-binding protein [Burkholderiaceae bacterium]|nr:ATP-binding protein [Burkholderiaceae bacterium]
MNSFPASQSFLDDLSAQGRHLFQLVATTTAVGMLAYIGLTWLLEGDPRRMIGPGVVLLAAALALAAMRAGQVRPAFSIFTWGIWVAVTTPALLWVSIANPSLYAYPALMVLAGWLLGVRQGYALCGASILASLAIALLQEQGVTGLALRRGPVEHWMALATVLVLSMVVLHRILKNQNRQSQKLQDLNRQLTDTVASLTTQEAELRHSQHRFNRLGNASPAPVSFTDLATGKLMDVNPAWERTFGWTRAEVVGRTPLEIGFWSSMEERAEVRSAIDSEGRFLGRELRLQTKSGQPIEILLAAEIIEQDGQALVMAVLTDVTERKRIEAEIRKLNEELELRVAQRTAELEHSNAELSTALQTLRHTQDELVQSEKLAALGGLVAGVAHELNTPVGNAMMVASSLHDRTREFEKVVVQGELRRSALDRFVADSLEATELVQRSLHRAADLVQSFKQVAVDQSSERWRRFQLHLVVHEVVDTLRPNLRKQPLQIEIDIPKDLILDSFPGPLGQVVINLVMNSVNHAFEGRAQGCIRLVGRRLDAQHIELLCIDDGVGIPPEVQSRIFDPFFTTKLGRGGSGLGLSIVYQLVTQVLGGQVTVKSTPGVGTTFTLRLPVTVPDAAPA